MALPDDFLPLTDIPEPLVAPLRHVHERLAQSLEQADNLAGMSARESPLEDWLGLSESRRKQMARVLAISDFVAETLVRYPEWLLHLDASGELDAAPDEQTLRAWLDERLEDAEDEAALHAAIRRFRRARMTGIVWRDLTRPPGVDMWATAAQVSRLAETCLEGALAWLERYLEPRWGNPAVRQDGSEQRLVVLGMGKLGAGELNLSSDIDLIFAFPEKGDTEGGRKSLEHQEYFTKLGQKLISALDAVTADGFAFRVDMRLRPLGDGGPLVGNFSSLAAYYQDQGREWERYAMLKARPVAGDVEAGGELLASLRPFVYRKYLDFGAIESLRELKGMINREVRRRGMQGNIKLGPGGIREVEFVVQAFQLIRGGRDTELQVTSLKTALRRLPELGLLPQEVVDELEPDYVLLRDLEHALQALEDRQTQSLPDDETDRERVALALDMQDWPALMARLDEVRGRVRRHFDAVVADPEDELEDDEEADTRNAEAQGVSLESWRALWRGEFDETEGRELFQSADFADPAGSLRRLNALGQSRQVQSMQRIGYERLEALMPMLLDAVAGSEAPDIALERVLPLIESVLRRTAYLALLRENPDALGHLMTLCSASPWIAEQIARYPILLDELLTPDTLYTPADKSRLSDELRQALGRIPEDDEEAQLETLRVFKHAQVLHVAASDIAGTRHLMKVSDYLTYIAEVILEAVLAMAWKHLTRKHGFPQTREGGRAGNDPEFLVVGYGKLGGIELGYGSDLDLVFIHDGASQGSTDGERPLDNSVFFTRLGQRIIHLLTAVTPAGTLYEVDMRLRPSGNSGLLVSTLSAFADYQRREAWTWEHQALVRARVVAGYARLAERFTEIRGEILGAKRDLDALRDEVVKMRQKMRDHLASKQEGETFDLKHDPGGMVDIEFLCQYAVLSMANDTPELLEWSDNMRILETLEATERLPAEECQRLRDAYLALRSAAHRASLTRDPSRGRDADFQAHRQAVIDAWQRLLSPDEGKSG
ncbi:bifunctional [glutamate--ammonia ligase]-adenylyl-L-tyrosine phosphorylase/[glutamate--ammonia-ligase] adenylyltransferase [Halomonas urumqiensis]|uniref:Bifunctional glutamine synthetase adenylyltransferase/adenylyl-removing enzyme n=1 Tax=Halomonas urumqiensis TaxID=1684789 RepID=A0A2N7ULG1_9GAMM|nr:bifunctional [glutamate--ammonia ligase]-adenylyl-L-tyrosine phosphorylase/[glutamate--ammonia-ligase] adenylyltransferase [Halomonas urumqiensis]PMR81274.1 bifunctional [glutamate--ammonia ligase]-adenylyl-L-tyrosine phosphorylase/[glutamate--ammonia-ligase] adenylyltransferase [Halomonas urumqiensis]PTB01795.1 bifunctional [glutamate--ammonia ligase]-adenylyl-L-tyrosine phosphorylase/[glutamate--ammonia-ligase] adenylyltransferase [Halomonas urumqiensis]GHE22169.1 glutamate-ammonia-ligase a